MSLDTMSEPTQEELLWRINERRENDMFGFEWPEYIVYLSRENAKPFLKPDAESEPKKWSRESVIEKMRDYLSFAFDKANNQRGLSASRSVMHYIAWTWLCGDREFSAKIETAADEDFAPYGKPVLRMIAEHYGWDWRSLDDGD